MEHKAERTYESGIYAVQKMFEYIKRKQNDDYIGTGENSGSAGNSLKVRRIMEKMELQVMIY